MHNSIVLAGAMSPAPHRKARPVMRMTRDSSVCSRVSTIAAGFVHLLRYRAYGDGRVALVDRLVLNCAGPAPKGHYRRLIGGDGHRRNKQR